MQLDAPGFNTVITPEVALGIVQKSVVKKNWRKYDIAQIKLVYTPYWVFSFDVLAEGGVPTGKAALNAYTGELSEFVPMLLDRPLKKSREVGKEAEVESTSIQQSEVKDVAATKVAAQAGIKRETVVISAVSKVYVPVFRIWVDLADDTFKVDVDACLGAPFGLEAIPQREKTWEEVTGETLEKMKTPKGLAELAGATVSSVAGGGKKSPLTSMLGSKEGQYLILALVIIVATFYLFARPAAYTVTCEPLPGYFSEKKELFGTTKILAPKPANLTNHLKVDGTCSVVNKGDKPLTVFVRIYITEDGKANFAAGTSVQVRETPPSTVPIIKDFSITWNRTAGVKQYALATEVT